MGRLHVIVFALWVEIKVYASCWAWADGHGRTGDDHGGRSRRTNRVVGALCESIFVIDGRGSR
jgi:hypothetical protein